MTEQPFAAAFTREQLYSRESAQNGWDTIRRSALAVLTRDHAQLADSINGDAEGCEAFMDLYDNIKRLQEQRQAEDELINSAAMRLLFVLGHEADKMQEASA